VHRDDIALLAMNGLREQYLMMRMKDSNGSPTEGNGQGHSLRGYLYDKYVYRNDEAKPDEARPAPAGEVRINLQRPAA